MVQQIRKSAMWLDRTLSALRQGGFRRHLGGRQITDCRCCGERRHADDSSLGNDEQTALTAPGYGLGTNHAPAARVFSLRSRLTDSCPAGRSPPTSSSPLRVNVESGCLPNLCSFSHN